MGKPLSRPDCLRQNPRCLGKGDEDEAYIEDCYVPQRSIYDTMRINEQIDQSAKLCQPSRSTLGSGGEVRGEGSTLSSNGTIGAELGSVFVSRNAEHAGGAKRLDERVIFDALKLTGDPQIMSPPVGLVGSGMANVPSASGSGGVAAVPKRRHQGGDKRDNPNRRSWKAFMPPSYPEFAERLEFSSTEGTEKRLSLAGIPLSTLQPTPPHLAPSTPTSSTPCLPPYTPSPSSSAPHTPPVSSSPCLTPTVSLLAPLQCPPSRQKLVHPVLQTQQSQTHVASSPTKEPLPTFSRTLAPQVSRNTPVHSANISRQVEKRREDHRRTSSSSKSGFGKIPEEPVESVKASDSEGDSPLLDPDQEDNAPLIPPKPVFCPPTKARTWPRSLTTGKRTQASLRRNLPVLPPLPPLLRDDSNTDEEALYLLDPPSPFLREEEGLLYGGLPLSPCISQEGCDEGLLGWCNKGGELERTASELKFEEDERRILEELEEEEQDECSSICEEEEAWQRERDKAEEERAQREEREWEAVLKLENREIMDQSWTRETLESEGWDLTGSSGHWPLLTPPTGFGGPGAPSVSPCPSSGAESDDLFLELERQCCVDEGEEGVEMSVDPEPLDPYTLPFLEEEGREEEAKTSWEHSERTLPLDAVNSIEPDSIAPDSETSAKDFLNPSEPTEPIRSFALVRAQDCEKEHGFIDEDCVVNYIPEKAEVGEEEMSYQTDSSGVHMSQPDRTGISDIARTDCEQARPARTEADPDSGASSERDGEECVERTSSPSYSLVNPYWGGVEEGAEQNKGILNEEEEELGTEWDVYDQSEPSLDSSERVIHDHSPEPPLAGEDTAGNECTQADDAQTSCEEEPVRSEACNPAVAQTCDLQGTCFASEMALAPTGVVLGPDMPVRQDPDLKISTEVTASTPKSDSAPSLLRPPSKPDCHGAGLDAKDSEAFVISDSFVYLAVSAPPQYPNNCPPSPLEDLISQSSLPKPPCYPDPEEEGSLLSPDSFVYMAAPERPQPGPSDGCSALEDTQELDLDSCSEGTHSGMDGVEFVLGSMTGDSDWESDGSALDFPPLVSTDQAWDQLEPGLLQGLFTQTETSQAEACRPQQDGPQTGATASHTDPILESGRSSTAENESTIFPSSDTDTEAEVCAHLPVCLISIRLHPAPHFGTVHLCTETS